MNRVEPTVEVVVTVDVTVNPARFVVQSSGGADVLRAATQKVLDDRLVELCGPGVALADDDYTRSFRGGSLGSALLAARRAAP